MPVEVVDERPVFPADDDTRIGILGFSLDVDDGGAVLVGFRNRLDPVVFVEIVNDGELRSDDDRPSLASLAEALPRLSMFDCLTARNDVICIPLLTVLSNSAYVAGSCVVMRLSMLLHSK